MDNSPVITRFQERLALLIGGGILLGLGIRDNHRRGKELHCSQVAAYCCAAA